MLNSRIKAAVFFVIGLFIFSMLDTILFAQNEPRERQYNPDSKIFIVSGYALKSGDAIQIDTNPDTVSYLNGIYVIDNKGRINLPIKGEIDLGDYNEHNFKNMLLDTYKNDLIYQSVQVNPMIRIGLVGGFTNPGFYYVNPNQTFWQVMAISGGPLERKLLKKAFLRRGDKKLSFKIFENIKESPSLYSLDLQSGDIIEIPNPAERTNWDTFRDILPIVGMISAVASVYLTYELTRSRAY